MSKAYVMIHLEITNQEEFISGFASKTRHSLRSLVGND
jgi:hypothetical protein